MTRPMGSRPTTDLDGFVTQITEHNIPGIGWVRKLSVERRDRSDGITWDEMQDLRDEWLGADTTAVEVFPRADELVNERNRRHLWEWPDCPFSLLKF